MKEQHCQTVATAYISATIKMKAAAILSIASLMCVDAFAPANPQRTQITTQLNFGIPTFGNNKGDEESKPDFQGDKPEKKIGMSGLVQLITAGMGSPFLGDFEGVDEETGKMMFSLEANNLVDEVRIFCLAHDTCRTSFLKCLLSQKIIS